MVYIRIKRNDTYIRSVKTKSKSTGELIDATGWTIYFTVREEIPDTATEDDTGAIISKTMVGSSTGIHTLTLTDEDTDIDPKEYVFDMQIIKADNSIHSTETGKFVIQADITRSS